MDDPNLAARNKSHSGRSAPSRPISSSLDSQLEELFLRYRRDGDSDALGEVFDHTAPELLRVARYLTKDPHLAVDVLQSTFVVAMERASDFDPARRLEPWLFGILARQAGALLRKERRRPTRHSEISTAPAAVEDASARETHDALRHAITELPTADREAIEAKLAGVDAHRFARRIAIEPATARQRLHRALVRLAKHLPRGLAPTLLFLIPEQRALAATRRTLLAHGGAKTAPGIPLLGGWIVSKTATLAVGAALLLCAWILLGSRPNSETPPRIEAIAPPSAEAPTPADREVEPETREELDDAPPSPAKAGVTESYVVTLSGIVGRILHSDGTPLRQAPVALLEWVPSDILDVASDDHAPQVIKDRGRTDDNGQFALSGVLPRGLHLLSIDPGGTWSRLRWIDLELPSGDTLDIGVVRLDDPVTLSGRVVDDDGAPIPGASVRASPLLTSIATYGAHRMRSDSLLLDTRGGATAVHDPPTWMGDLVSYLPLPATTTDQQGRFELRGTERGIVTAVVNKPGFVSTASRPMPSGRGAGRDLGEITLHQGRRIRGSVTREGKPVSGATIAVGVLGSSFAVLSTQTDSDPSGEFELGNAPDGDLVGVVQIGGDPWIRFDVPDEGEVEIDLKGAATARVIVVDPDGEPIQAPRFRVRRTTSTSRAIPGLARFEATTAERAPDCWRVSVGEGDCELRVAADGFAPTTVSVEPSKELDTQVTLSPALRGEVRVIDADTGRALPFTKVTVSEAPPPASELGPADLLELVMPSIDQARTDIDGIAPFPALPPGRTLLIVAQHPGYANSHLEWSFDRGLAELALFRGAALHVRVDAGGRAPATPVHVCLRRIGPVLGHPDDQLLRVNTTDPRGDLTYHGLPAGSYFYQARRRAPARTPTGLGWDQLLGPEVLTQGFLDIAPNTDKHLTIEIHAPENPRSATIRGRVRRRGTPLAGARVTVDHEFSQEARTGDDGSFELAGAPRGRSVLSVHAPGTASLTRSVDCPAGETVQLDIDLDDFLVTISATDSGGKPIDNAHVACRGTDPSSSISHTWGTTGEDGSVQLELAVQGSYEIEVRHPTHGSGWRRVVFSPAKTTSVVIVDRGVPFAGRVVDPQPDATGNAWLRITNTETRDEITTQRTRHLTLRANRSFSLRGLPEGAYQIRYRDHDRESAPIHLELGPTGEPDLRLRFPDLSPRSP